MSNQDSANFQQDGMIASVDHPIKLPAFEGPIDLLLFLIRRNEINIYDIPIKEVTEQYLDILSHMGKMNLEIAGDFFVMAATLMYIKSRMLLPKHEQKIEQADEEEGIDPRWELVQQLIQYKKYKQIAAELEEYIARSQDSVPRCTTVSSQTTTEEAPLLNTDSMEMWNLFNMVARRMADRLVVGEIHDEEVTVSECMERILELRAERKIFLFSSLIPEKCSVTRLAATFLAILELTRVKKLTLEQSEIFGDIEITPRFEDEPTNPNSTTHSSEASEHIVSEFDSPEELSPNETIILDEEES